jgi:hypothetical protein
MTHKGLPLFGATDILGRVQSKCCSKVRFVRPKQTFGYLLNECCQMCITRHPRRRNSLLMRLSRSEFRRSFEIQKARLVLGTERQRGHACQKHPTTKTSTRSLEKRRSGLPAIATCRLQPRRPPDFGRRASFCSVRAFPLLRFFDIRAERLFVVKRSGMHGSHWVTQKALVQLDAYRYLAIVAPCNAALRHVRSALPNEQTMHVQSDKVSLITGYALTAFANNAHANEHRLKSIWLISPWLSKEDSKDDPIRLIAQTVKSSKCNLTIITRQPEAHWHADALQVLAQTSRAAIFFCANLHTKLYILECDGYRSAITGSPNLTAGGNRANRELAIHFHTTMQSASNDIVAALIDSLSEYATSLVAEDDVHLQTTTHKHHAT